MQTIHLDEATRLLCVNTIKMLAVDAVEQANSGHPGMPMGTAALTFELWMRHLRYMPSDPHWVNRDRFVLSAGHGSMLLYAMLHLAGFDLPMHELQRFRQLDSKTPGHPELHLTPGIETTTGPLGQGFANGVGMAIAAKMLHARFAEHELSTHRIFGIVSDGDLMEGISHEAASLAGHLGLDNLIYIYDDNHISIDGPTELALSDDAMKRFESYGWFVQRLDGHDPEQIRRALDAAVAEPHRPSILCARTHIGHGSPGKQDSSKAHGSPLGKAEIAATKKALGWPEEPTFYVPEAVRKVFEARAALLNDEYQQWQRKVQSLPKDVAERWQTLTERKMPVDLAERLFEAGQALMAKPEATRALAGKIEQVAAQACPWLVGGSADLNPSTNTMIEGSKAITHDSFEGRNIHFGVREHAMASINNGLCIHGSFVAFGSTFLVFSDYMRPAIRLASLMNQPNLFIFTHDSIFLGEDGPTHQPIEHLAALRLIPGLRVVRPANALECAAAWAYALERKQAPTALILSRQKLTPIQASNPVDVHTMMHGAYRVVDPSNANVVVIATGSEVAPAVEAAQKLTQHNIYARVISAPCLEALEDAGPSIYQSVLPNDGLPRVSIEAGRTSGWKSLVGHKGLTLGIDRFGASAPDTDLARYFELTPDAIAQKIQKWFVSM